MKTKCPFYIVFQVFNVLLVKILRYAKKDTATTSFISCCFIVKAYINRYHFSQIFRTLLNIS